ncbi:hypothetical protein D3C78_1511590 [compost metagenome]
MRSPAVARPSRYSVSKLEPNSGRGLISSASRAITSDTESTTAPTMRRPTLRMITTVNWS